MLVMPLLQLSLAFRMLFSSWLSPAPRGRMAEPWWRASSISVAGAMLVCIDTGLIVHTLALPEALSRALLWRV